MKSTIKEVAPTEKPSQFPILKKWIGNGNKIVVLFTKETKGFLVGQNGSLSEIGYTGLNNGWISCFDKDWVDFEGQVILEN